MQPVNLRYASSVLFQITLNIKNLIRQLCSPRLHAPDLPGILGNSSVRAELACNHHHHYRHLITIIIIIIITVLTAAGYVVDGHLRPARLVPVHRGHHVLAADVGLHTGNGKYLLPALKIFASDC